MSNKSKKETEVQGAEVESFERANLISTVENAYNDSRETKKEQAKSVSYALKAVCKHLDTLKEARLMHETIHEQVMLELEASKRAFVRREFGI